MKIYSYCIIDSKERIADDHARGLNGTPVYNIPYRDMGIVVSNVNLHIKDLTKSHILEHEDVVERLMENFTVLPLRSGTLFNREEEILPVMEKFYGDFRSNLDRLINKVEFGIKIIWPGDNIRGEILEDYASSSHFLAATKDSPGKRFIMGKFEKYKIERALKEKAEICIAFVDNFLNRFAFEIKLEKLISTNLLLNAFYLVDKERQRDFKEAFELLRIAPDNFKYLFSGPWPPYNFIRMGE